MNELLAPAGNYEAFKTAISNGADAIYLGLSVFSARAYASNFSLNELETAIRYAHLRGVRIYVTMNTVIYEKEIDEAYRCIDQLNSLGVDAVIVQDLAILYYLQKYPNIEIHASTQMGIEDLNGVKTMETLGVSRVVLARETSIDTIKFIKGRTKMPLEVFAHGALCVSFSGNCLMSGLIGMRSGNRGRCVGSCRNKYTLVNDTIDEELGSSYILSMKDLCTVNHLDELSIVDSLKIEGRMKEPYYVSNVVSAYRKALDGNDISPLEHQLSRTFNRTYTKGYLFYEDPKDIVNIARPNNSGFYTGKVVKQDGKKTYLDLKYPLSRGDMIRIDSSSEVSVCVNKMYSTDNHLIDSLSGKGYIILPDKIDSNSPIYKTRDANYIRELKTSTVDVSKTYPIHIFISGNIDDFLQVNISFEDKMITSISKFTIEKSLHIPTGKDIIIKQFSKMDDNPYTIAGIEIDLPDNIYISIRNINEIRRDAIEKLNELRLEKEDLVSELPSDCKFGFTSISPQLAVYCQNDEQYEAAKGLGIKTIYYNNVIRRNMPNYREIEGDVLVGGFGGIDVYQGKNIISDFSFNVVNSRSVHELYRLGVKRVTISHEINNKDINKLVDSYIANFGEEPNLEMIVYGRQDLLFTKYCPLKTYNQCGKCKKNDYVLKDEVSYFPLISHQDCSTTILNGKILNLIDNLWDIKGINYYRIQLTTENKDEALSVISSFINKLKNLPYERGFNQKTDTRGHFNREIV